MGYQVIIPNSVQKELNRLPVPFFKRIIEELRRLEENPRPAGCKKLRGRQGWRIRSGDYRIIYEINDDNESVIIFRIRHRQEVYKN